MRGKRGKLKSKKVNAARVVESDCEPEPDQDEEDWENTNGNNSNNCQTEIYKEALKNFRDTAEAINRFVTACTYFREENPRINKLLQHTLERFLEGVGPLIPVDTLKEFSPVDPNVDVDVDPDQPSTLASKPNRNPICSRKRKVVTETGNNEVVERETRSDSRSKKFRIDNFVINDNNNNIDNQDQEPETVELEQKSVCDDAPPVVKVLKTYSLLELIFNYLNKKDLLTCRSVNSRWNKISSEILKKSLKLIFTCTTDDLFVVSVNSRNSAPPLKWTKKNLNTKRLKHLTNLLKFDQWEFPCTNFIFDGCNFFNPETQYFFTLHGQYIKTLSISIGINETTKHKPSNFAGAVMNGLQKILLYRAPNIKKLIINGYSSNWIEQNYRCDIFPHSVPKNLPNNSNANNNKNTNNVKPTVLKKLQFLHFECIVPEEFVKNLLEVAKNLKEITWDSSVENKIILRPLVKLYGCEFVKKIDLNLPQLNTSIFGGFSQMCSNLQELNVHFEDSWILNPEKYDAVNGSMKILSRILATSASTLKKLSVPPLGSLNTNTMSIPIMYKLEDFVVKIPNFIVESSVSEREENACMEIFEGVQSFFTKNLSISQTFPMLKRLKSTKLHNLASKIYWEKCFSNFWQIGSIDCSCPFLKEIDFSELVSPPIVWLEKIPFMFPSLRVLKLGNIGNITAAMEIICKCSLLQILEIGIDYKSWHNQFPSVDSAFTGFLKETCVQIYENPASVDVDCLDGLRVTKSITDLKSLRQFTIYFMFDPDNKNQASEKVMNDAPILSLVSGLLAFHVCPLLLVDLVLDGRLNGIIESGLDPILPYVNSVSRKKLQKQTG